MAARPGQARRGAAARARLAAGRRPPRRAPSPPCARGLRPAAAPRPAPAWLELAAAPTSELAGGPARAARDVLAARFGPGHPVRTPPRPRSLPSIPLLRGAAELAAETGRAADLRVPARPASGRQPAPVHAHPGRARRADGRTRRRPPAPCSTRPAAPAPCCAPSPPADRCVYAQESRPRAGRAHRAAPRAATDPAVRVAVRPATACAPTPTRELPPTPCCATRRSTSATGATTNSPTTRAGSTASRPAPSPNWPGCSTRWPVCGTAAPPSCSCRPPRPPAVPAAAIRADLLRRGALRAVSPCPAGAAPPYGIPLHLWVLRRPGPAPAPPGAAARRHRPAVRRRHGRGEGATGTPCARRCWTPGGLRPAGAVADRPGLSRALPVIELLDDDVDLTPARHLPPPAAAGGAEQLDRRARPAGRDPAPAPPTSPRRPAGAARARRAGRPPRSANSRAAGALVLRAGGTGRPRARAPCSPSTTSRPATGALRHAARGPRGAGADGAGRRRRAGARRGRGGAGGRRRRPAGAALGRNLVAAAPRPGGARPVVPRRLPARHRQQPPGQQLRLHRHPARRAPAPGAPAPAGRTAALRRAVPRAGGVRGGAPAGGPARRAARARACTTG